MKTTTLITSLLAALSGLAHAEDPAPVRPGAVPTPPLPPPTPGVPAGPPGDMNKPRAEILEYSDPAGMDAPIRWTYLHGAMDDQPLRTGPVTYLGVSASPPPRELAAHLAIDADTGLLVDVVAPDSPAEKAGLQASDVLVRIDDQILIHPRQLSVLVANKRDGDSVKITYIRKGRTHEADAVLGKRDAGQVPRHLPQGAMGGFSGLGAASDDMHADILLGGSPDGGPLRTFVRRFEIPGGGDMKIAGSMTPGGGTATPPLPSDPARGPAPAPEPAQVPPGDDVKKELAEIRAMLEALQQKLK